jgi:glycosyltransferase involved in cell wall biosynthesis
LLFPGKTDIDESKKRFSEEGVCRVIDSINPITWLRTAWRIARTKADVVIFPWWVSFWALQFWTISAVVRSFSNSKVLFICHNVVEHEPKQIDRVLTKSALRNGDCFVVHSKEDEKNLLLMLPDAKVRRSFHPTYDMFNFQDFDSGIVRRKFGIQGNVLLFFGFIREYKGLKYLISALPDVLSKIDVTLLVVGEFWNDKQEYVDLIEELDLEEKIVLVDEYIPNEEVGFYFSAADLVVQPYVSGTGSGVIQIAFGFNKPVIATRVGSLPEVVENGKTGFLVEPESPRELADAIIKFFQDGKKELFSANVRGEMEKFSWDRMVDVIEELAAPRCMCA